MDHLLYGCAYYDEYMPYERLDKDLVFVFCLVINVLEACDRV